MIPADLLLHAYRSGAFPMATPTGEIAWFSPDPRAIIPLDERFHIPHGLGRTLKKNVFEIRINAAFEEVLAGAAPLRLDVVGSSGEVLNTLETGLGNLPVQPGSGRVQDPGEAPKTVENFIGLANGSKEWTNPATGKKMKGVPLYDNTVFHRLAHMSHRRADG